MSITNQCLNLWVKTNFDNEQKNLNFKYIDLKNYSKSLKINANLCSEKWLLKLSSKFSNQNAIMININNIEKKI